MTSASAGALPGNLRERETGPRRCFRLAAAGLLLTVAGWGVWKTWPEGKDAESFDPAGQLPTVPPAPQKTEVVLRSLPARTAGVVRLEVQPLLGHAWVRNHFNAGIRRAAVGHSFWNRLASVLERPWERIDRLVIALTAGGKADDLWAVQGRFRAAELVNLAARPDESDNRGSSVFLAPLSANAVALAERRPALREALLQEASRPTGRLRELRQLIRERRPDQVLWFAAHRDLFDRVPGPASQLLVNDGSILMECVQTAHGGLSLGPQVRLEVTFTVRDYDGVDRLESLLNRWLLLVRGGPRLFAGDEHAAAVLPLLATGHVSVQGRRVVLRCAIGQGELEEEVARLRRAAGWTD